jgi:hypothetical protein
MGKDEVKDWPAIIIQKGKLTLKSGKIDSNP